MFSDRSNLSKLIPYSKGYPIHRAIPFRFKITKINKNIVEIIILNDGYYKALLEQKDFELNSLDYEEALKLDHRNYFQYYISLIKNIHPIIFSFASYKDYNS